MKQDTFTEVLRGFLQNARDSLQKVSSKFRSLDGIVSIVTGYRLDVSAFALRSEYEVLSCPYPFIPVLRPYRPSVQVVAGLFLGVNAVGAWR